MSAGDCEREIRELHAFFQGWDNGEIADTDEAFSRFDEVMADLWVAEGGEYGDGKILVDVAGADLMDQTVPIHVGHGQVSQYQIDMTHAQNVEGLLAVANGDHIGEADLAEHTGDDTTHVADVFYEQDDQALESILSSDLGQPLSSRICLIASLK